MDILFMHYHRNGITGTAFYTGEIVDDENEHYMFVQFVDDISHTSILKLDSEGCPDLEETMRGDHFADAIKKAIVEVQTP